MSSFDEQVGGDHYKRFKIQPLEYALQNDLGICEHAVIKYVTRWRDKGGADDLLKARHYIDLLLEFEGKGGCKNWETEKLGKLGKPGN
tara:strand:- start:1790 stop:2053 length:264 start_codon:yes stop_codon:yes gene_type:complete